MPAQPTQTRPHHVPSQQQRRRSAEAAKKNLELQKKTQELLQRQIEQQKVTSEDYIASALVLALASALVLALASALVLALAMAFSSILLCNWRTFRKDKIVTTQILLNSKCLDMLILHNGICS